MEAAIGSSALHATTELSDKQTMRMLGAKQGFIACSMSRTAASRFAGSRSRYCNRRCASLRRATYIDASAFA